jgi:ABC-2 type transport system ATP-binding protein
MPQFIYTMKNLRKVTPQGKEILKGIWLSFFHGAKIGVLGANGAGKSTTIRLFLDLIRPTSGTTRIAGTSVQAEPLRAKAQVSYVAENVELYSELTALQNLDFFGRLAGRRPSAAELAATLRRVGLEDEAHRRRLKTVSKGMRQKTGLAVAILRDAPALILDEPTSGLDPRAAWELVRLLQELRDEGRAILMSTHDVFRAKQVADRVCIMTAGRLVAGDARRVAGAGPRGLPALGRGAGRRRCRTGCGRGLRAGQDQRSEVA